MAKKKVQDVNEIAQQLLEIRLEKNRLTKDEKLLSEALKSHPNFKKQDLFKITPVPTMKVQDEEKALTWIKKDAPGLLKIDTSAALKWFRQNLTYTPENYGFTVTLSDRLVAAKGEEE